MKITEMIIKFKLELGTKPDGTEGVKTSKKLTAKQIEILKAHREEILVELKKQKAEKEARWEELRRQHEKEHAEKEAEYLKTADLRRCLVVWQDEYYNTTWSMQTLAFSDGRAWRPQYGKINYKELAHMTETMDEITKVEGTEFGIGGAVWEITPEQEEQILEEQVPAKEEAEKEAAEERAKKEAAKQAKRDEEKKVREEYRATMQVEVLEKGYTYGEEKDPYAKVRITDVKTVESGIFTCRNIFDFGYVINHEEGGILVDGKWDAPDGQRDATEFEIKAVRYLYEFPPISPEIRM